MHSDWFRRDSNLYPKANNSQSQKDAEGHIGFYNRLVGGHPPSIPDEGFGKCGEKHRAKEITEVGKGKSGKGGEEYVDGRGGREEAVNKVIERARRDLELGEHKQRSLWCIVDPCKSSPL